MDFTTHRSFHVGQTKLNMSFYFLLRVFALCVLALLVAADSPNHAEIHGRSTIKTANKLSCIKSDVSLVKKEVSHPLEFCKFYLSEYVQTDGYI